jgi:hypothetical protein
MLRLAWRHHLPAPSCGAWLCWRCHGGLALRRPSILVSPVRELRQPVNLRALLRARPWCPWRRLWLHHFEILLSSVTLSDSNEAPEGARPRRAVHLHAGCAGSAVVRAQLRAGKPRLLDPLVLCATEREGERMLLTAMAHAVLVVSVGLRRHGWERRKGKGRCRRQC